MTLEALETARQPVRQPIFFYSKFPENGRIWVVAHVDWGHANLDSEARNVCSDAESHTFFSELEDELVQDLYQILKRRHKQSPPPLPAP